MPAAKRPLNPWLKLALETGPLILLFFANSRPALFTPLVLLNEIIWRTQTTDFSVSFKVFGVVPLTFVFAALQYPLLQKYAVEEELPPVIPAEPSESRDP